MIEQKQNEKFVQLSRLLFDLAKIIWCELADNSLNSYFTLCVCKPNQG